MSNMNGKMALIRPTGRIFEKESVKTDRRGVDNLRCLTGSLIVSGVAPCA
jgi:hypothetical protein